MARLAIVSCTAGLVAISTSPVAVAASPGGGVLPPPPPPPPQQRLTASSESSAITKDDPITSIVEPSAEAPGEEVSDAESNETEKITEDAGNSPSKPSDSTSDAPVAKSTWGEESGGMAESAQQQPLQPLSDQQWGNGGSAQYPNQYNYQQQWQQQHPPSWGQSYQQPQAQQRYYQQQSYPQSYPQQQPGQLAVYRRPAPTAPRRSAPGLFSLAVKKLQTGIDTVSESIDVNKVASSVSGITSRLGEIGSNIAGNAGRSAPTRSRPPNMGGSMMPGQRGPMPGAGRDPRMGQQRPGQQGRHPQRMPPGSRQRPVTKETFAPPINDLYSLEQQEASSGPEKENAGGADGYAEADATDVEDESYLDMTQKQQSAPIQPALSGEAPQSRPFPNEEQSPPFRMEQPRTSPAQSNGRIPPSSTPLRPRNAGVTTPSTGAGRRRYEDYDDDDDSSSLGHKVKSALGAFVPRVPNLFNKDSDMTYDDGAWSDDEGSGGRGFFSGRSKAKGASYMPPSSRGSSIKTSTIPRPVQSLLEKRDTLLSSASARKCSSVGRSQAILDAGQVALLIVVSKEVVPLFFDALSKAKDAEGGGGVRQAIISTVLSATDGWAPLALAAVFLLSASDNVWVRPGLKAAYTEAATENASDAAYAQLYLRLISSLPMQKSFSTEVMKKTARATALQIASLARLRFFVSLAILYVLLSTVAVLRPAGTAVMSAMVELVRLIPPMSSWREADWRSAVGGVKGVGLALGHDLSALIGTEWNIVKDRPLRVAVVASLVMALLAVSALPSLERGSSRPTSDPQDEEDVGDDTITSLWSNIGASSATRLGLLSSPRGVEGALAQFTKLRPDRAAAAGIALPGEQSIKKRRRRRQSPDKFELSTLQTVLKSVLYSASSLALLSVPFAAFLYLLASAEVDGSRVISAKEIPETGWLSLLELATLLVFTHMQLGNAVSATIQANKARLGHSVSSFFHKLAGTVSEVQKLSAESSATADFQAMLTASPTKGISVSDLWAAHSSKRAWAVKGANLQCQNGEVVLIVGADGAGKTRLLTAIAERIFAPPKSARTTTYVRGSVNVGGVELAKWDLASVQKRVGVFLNDVRTISDYASLMSGCTLDEILEPVPLEGGRIGPKERNSMSVAMKITGIRNDLLSRLPSKLSTVVSANEDELKPSPLRPPSSPLSPEDWTRVLLTKILAQLISGNENQLSSPDTVRKCMIGSVLLLDDATTQMSEANEARFISALRSTGAAVLLTSSRWATGRFADRIVVIDNGSVVESGTHADLLNIGPERSLYAKQWSSMS